MKIRFLTTIAGERWAFRRGQVIEVDEPTPEMLALLRPLPDGTRRAEVVRDEDEGEVAVDESTPEHAVVPRRRTRRG